MKNLIIITFVASLVTAGCAMKQKIMDASLVSMTQTAVPEGAQLKDTGPVSGKFCADMMSNRGSIGLFDESVKNAQSTSGVDFISNATFWNEDGCVTVEGTGQKLLTNSSISPETTAPAKKKQ